MRARKVDSTQQTIVSAIRSCGWEVFLVGIPCDAFCYKNGVWKALEIKVPRNKRGDPRLDKRQTAQADFCARTQTPYVTDAKAALEALGEKLTFGGV